MLLLTVRPYGGPTTPAPPQRYWFGLFPFRSPLLRESRLISLPPGTEMFQFSGFASRLLEILCLQHSGLPHSDTCGSTRACQSPQLFAACRVLHRLREPRHSPCALVYFRSFVHPKPVAQPRAFAILACSRQALPRSPALLYLRTSKIVIPLAGKCRVRGCKPHGSLAETRPCGRPSRLAAQRL